MIDSLADYNCGRHRRATSASPTESRSEGETILYSAAACGMPICAPETTAKRAMKRSRT